MRSLNGVLAKMIELTPNKELKTALIRIQACSLYAAPEVQRDYWTRASLALEEAIPDGPKEDWERKIIKIFQDKE